MYQIKNLDVLNVHNVVQMIHNDLVEFFEYEGFRIITSGFRPNDPGVHGTLPSRGLDVRCHDDNIGKMAQDYLNDLWCYDPNRPEKGVALYHDAGSGSHLHLQCHPNTMRR